MNVVVFGLGYVGSVTAACLARLGHRVIGVDISAEKVALVISGRPPVFEPGLAQIVAETVANRRLMATTEAAAALAESDLALICVGTPALPSGQPDTSAIATVGRQIGRALAGRTGSFTAVLRSTALPGTVEHVLRAAILEHAGLRVDLRVAANPEFMREGSAVEDFDRPPIVLVGADAPSVISRMRELYAGVDAPFVETSIRTAEAAKYASNAFHALKVTFANEMAAICDQVGADAQDVMRIFALDRKLNISEAYLKPGFAFGGPCLPKDVHALAWAAEHHQIETPMLSAVIESNSQLITRAIDTIARTGKTRIGLAALAFKPGTEDLRHSPMVAVVKALVARGCDVKVLDRQIVLPSLLGENRRYLSAEIPDIASRLCPDMDSLIAHADVLVIGTTSDDAERAAKLVAPGCVVIDLPRALSKPSIEKDPSRTHRAERATMARAQLES